jgi:hypothetical protein
MCSGNPDWLCSSVDDCIVGRDPGCYEKSTCLNKCVGPPPKPRSKLVHNIAIILGIGIGIVGLLSIVIMFIENRMHRRLTS